ncbi:helix-turn-helix transcriptional regulator [Streptomyces sp. NPDC059688]|uniref:helix-turn-helix transcriptional regulator n=1 Tax=Streptomyces sp. NPDC059688 TaxID=3346906 RepID=UPI00369D2EC0
MTAHRKPTTSEVALDVAFAVAAWVRGTMHEAVNQLLNRPADLPLPSIRTALRRAHRLTQQEVAEAIGVHRIQVVRWEKGQAEPRNPHRRAYAHLLAGLAEQHPEVLSGTSTP